MPPQQPASTFQLPTNKSSKNTWVVIVLAILLVAAIGFGAWAFQSRQDYKKNSDKKAAVASSAAAQSQSAKDQASFAQQLKAPYKTYTSSSTDGSISFSYPKTWSAYVDETSSDTPLNGYFYPNVVPGVQSTTAFALRLRLVSDTYTNVVNSFQGSVTAGKVTAAAYLPPKMKGVANAQIGTRFDGTITQDGPNFQGAMVVLTIRDKTLEIYTDSSDFLSDFNNVVLPNLSYSP